MVHRPDIIKENGMRCSSITDGTAKNRKLSMSRNKSSAIVIEKYGFQDTIISDVLKFKSPEEEEQNAIQGDEEEILSSNQQKIFIIFSK